MPVPGTPTVTTRLVVPTGVHDMTDDRVRGSTRASTWKPLSPVDVYITQPGGFQGIAQPTVGVTMSS
jgi:hypothetical protein